MENLKVFNVEGDGSCYYRCVWHLAKENPEVAQALFVDDREDEECGCEEVIKYVALSLRFEKPTKDYLRNLIEVYKEVPDIIGNYPLLGYIDANDDFESICSSIADCIENTRMMASSLEHEVISNRLSTINYDSASDIQIIVVKQPNNADDLMKKLLVELATTLPKLACSENEDDIHYKYVQFEDELVINRKNTYKTQLGKRLTQINQFSDLHHLFVFYGI